VAKVGGLDDGHMVISTGVQHTSDRVDGRHRTGHSQVALATAVSSPEV